MSSFQKHRFWIFTQVQHPLKHSLDDFAYTNPGLGSQVTTVQQAMDWIFAVLYPQSKTAVDTPGDLPLVGNSLNDMRVVNDDGDGKAASYRWEQREGEASPSWHKIYDMDWGVDSILQQMYLKTQDLYVSKKGYNELDANGDPLTGNLAGAYIYGGATANTHLTLYANSGDGVGPNTGYVQFGDNSRPLADNTFDFGTASEQWKKIWSLEYQAGTLNLQGGSITDSNGEIDFGATDLVTTGSISASSLDVPSILVGGTLSLASGSITDSGGAIDFGNENLSTTGTLASNVLTIIVGLENLVISPDVAGEANINSTQGVLNFNSLDLITVGDMAAANGNFSSSVSGGNLQFTGNTLVSLDTDGDIIILPDGTGIVDVQRPMTTLDITATGTVSVTGQVNADNLRLDGNTLSSTDTDGNINILPNGAGAVVTKGIQPNADATYTLGAMASRWTTLYLSTGLSDGTDAVGIAALLSLSEVLVGAMDGHILFYNSVSGKWEADHPDSEIDHGELSGLADDDHAQYLLLAGRSGGQAIVGGTLANNNLTLESTSNATKGDVLTKDDFLPFTNASYSAGWLGIDIGGTSNFFRHVYTKGEHFNFRVENLSADFSSSSQNPGRIAYNTTTGLLIYDTGSAVKNVGAQHSETDTVWNGSDITKNVTVSDVSDARKAIWALYDNTNNFEQVYAKITKTSATSVTIDVNVALPAGTYRLIGIQ